MAWVVERRARRAVSAVFGALARGEGIPPSAVDLRRVRRVLFVRSNHRMGNLLLVTPALAAARRALPGAEIDLLTGHAYHELLRGNPDVDRVWTLERGHWIRPGALAGLLHRLRRRSYDLVIDASDGGSLSGALLAALSGGRWMVGPSPSRHEAVFDVRVPRPPEARHVVECLGWLLQGIGIPFEDPRMKVVLSPAEIHGAEAVWEALGLAPDRPAVGLNVGARGEKRWPLERFLEIARRLDADAGLQGVVFAGPEDRHRRAAIRDRLPRSVPLAPLVGVRRFAALLARCAVVVTGDTGPMHLAAAVGVPTVAVFLRPDHGRYRPLGPDHRAVRAGTGPEATGAVLAAVGAVLERRTAGSTPLRSA